MKIDEFVDDLLHFPFGSILFSAISYHIKYSQSGTKWRKVEQNSLKRKRGGDIC